MSFLEKVVAILLNMNEISGLNFDDLIALETGEPIGGKVEGPILMILMRLQTMIVQECEKGSRPEGADEFFGLEPEADESGAATSIASANALKLYDDTTARVLMLERIITEVIRQAIPTECERFGARYCIAPNGRVLWSPVSST